MVATAISASGFDDGVCPAASGVITTTVSPRPFDFAAADDTSTPMPAPKPIANPASAKYRRRRERVSSGVAAGMCHTLIFAVCGVQPFAVDALDGINVSIGAFGDGRTASPECCDSVYVICDARVDGCGCGGCCASRSSRSACSRNQRA